LEIPFSENLKTPIEERKKEKIQKEEKERSQTSVLAVNVYFAKPGNRL
jgi:hypothetical protein